MKAENFPSRDRKVFGECAIDLIGRKPEICNFLFGIFKGNDEGLKVKGKVGDIPVLLDGCKITCLRSYFSVDLIGATKFYVKFIRVCNFDTVLWFISGIIVEPPDIKTCFKRVFKIVKSMKRKRHNTHGDDVFW